MARFLPNSGDIILDACLTDEGRRRMSGGASAKFSIDMYAFGDDEINYELWNANEATAYKDLNILSTPILEAITDNASALKHKLKSLKAGKDYLYLPNLKLRDKSAGLGDNRGFPMAASPHANKYVILTTTDAYDLVSTHWGANGITGWINGTTAAKAGESKLVVDQGILVDAGGNNYSNQLSNELEENQYLIQIDDRFGSIVDPTGLGTILEKSFVDDDYIATYLVSAPGLGAVGSAMFRPSPLGALEYSDHAGARGQRLWFSIMASDHLSKSTAHFTEFGSTVTAAFPAAFTNDSAATNGYALDTIIRIDGWKTGMSLDIPIRFMREIPAQLLG